MTSNCRVVRNIFWKHFYRIGIFTRWLFLNTTKPNSWARSCWPRRNDVLSSVVAFVTNLGMLRKTRHWSFKSWTLDVKSVPSHCRQAHRKKQTHTHTRKWAAVLLYKRRQLDWQRLTTTRMCFDRSLELPIRKSENAVCMAVTNMHLWMFVWHCLKGHTRHTKSGI